MEAKEFIQKLDPKNSYWEMRCGIMTQLNRVSINPNNVWVVFWCSFCDGENETEYHAVPYTKLKVDEEGDYVVCCPNNPEGRLENYVSGDCIPDKQKELFKKTKFEKYVEPNGSDNDF